MQVSGCGLPEPPEVLLSSQASSSGMSCSSDNDDRDSDGIVAMAMSTGMMMTLLRAKDVAGAGPADGDSNP